MKNVTVLLFLQLLFPLIMSAQKIDLQQDTLTVQEAIYLLNQKYNYSIVINADDVELDKEVILKKESAGVEDVLKQIFEGQNVDFTIKGKRITVLKSAAAYPNESTDETENRIPLSGRIFDSQGEPLIGAAIVVEGTDIGVLSDMDGRYELPPLVYPAGITVSYIGFTPEKITLNGKETSPYDIFMSESMNILDDVVVVGYGTMKKRNVAGAVDQVDNKILQNRANSNLARSLQGEIAGLNITFTDSKASRSASFNVRGETSIGAGGSTLVLIDGVEGDLNTINPQDVESITVLKDASSTAVYGARGAFGVILVTTKTPQKGTPSINYSGSFTLNRRTVIPDVITDGLTWVNWWKDSYNGYYNGSKALLNHIDSTVPYTEEIYNELVRRRNDPSLTKVTELKGHDLFGWAYMESTDWYDLFYKDYNWSTEHNVSVSGGTNLTDYYLSGRFYDMDGIYKVGNESYKKYDLRAKGSLQIRPWLKVTNNISVSIIDQYEPKHPRNNFNVQRAINHVGMPLSPVKNPDGTWTAASAISGYASFCEGTSYRTNDHVYLREKISAEIDIVKDVLVAQADYSFNYTTRKRIDVQQPVEYSKKPGVILLESESAGASLSQVNYNTRYHAANAYLTYSPHLGQKNELTILAGWNIEKQVYETLTVSRKDFITSDKPSFSLMDGVSSDPVSGGNAWSYVGAFYRINYALMNRYLLELSGRYDGSSKFPVHSKWGFFPSASLAWIISDETWMSWASPIVNNAKIRVSAGSMGNGNVNPYSYTSEMSISTATDIVIGGEYPTYTQVGTTVPFSLTWEKATTYDIGLDLDFFANRLSFTGDIYRRYTTDMYTPSVSLPSVYGTTSPKGNNAELKTDGWEISLMWRDECRLGGKPLNYSIKAMIWDNKSTITKYANDTRSLGTVKGYIQNGGSPSSYYVGMTLGEIWGYTVEGLFKDQQDINESAIHNFQQASDKVTRPGQVKIADLDENGFIDPGKFTVDDHGDLAIIGNQSPRYRFGFNLSANWNGIGLSIFLQGVGKRDWYPGSDAGYFWGKYGRPFFSFIPSIHNYTDDMYSEEKNNWDTAYWPRITTYQSNGTYNWTKVLEIPNTRYMQNAAYLRIKNIQIDYTFPAKLCKKIKLQGLKIYLSGENLFTFTPLHKYAPNYDPEGLSYDTDFASAADGYTYPVLKSITAGLNITF